MNDPLGGCSPDSKFTVYDKLRVKAKILVRGVRQMNSNEIPDLANGCEKVLQSAMHAKLPI